MKKPDLGTVLFGIVLIFIGAGYLYGSLEFGDFKIFFNGWWLYLIILFAVADMVKKRIRPINCLIVFLCVWELLYRYDVIARGVTFSVLFALLFILWGIYVIFGNLSTSREKVCILKTQTYSASGQPIEQVHCVMGYCVIDLRSGTYQNGQALKVKCVLGGVEILAPCDLKVSPVCSGNIMGTFSDKSDKLDHSEKEIILDYSIVMGSVELRSEGEKR